MKTISAHILMFHVLEVLQFSVGAFGVDDSLKWTSQLLHRNPHGLIRVQCSTESDKYRAFC